MADLRHNESSDSSNCVAGFAVALVTLEADEIVRSCKVNIDKWGGKPGTCDRSSVAEGNPPALVMAGVLGGEGETANSGRELPSD